MKTWFKTKVFCLSVLALVVSFFITESTIGTYTVFSTYLFANFDSRTKGDVVEAKMWHSSTYRSGGRYDYKIEYHYTVEDKKYIGSLVRLERQSWPSGDRQIVEELLEKYPLGDEITVYYDSAKPEFSILEPVGLSRNFVLQHIFFLVAVPSMVWFCSWAYRDAF